MSRFSETIKNHAEMITVLTAILLAYAFNEAANNVSALILIISGIGLYIYCACKENNLFSFSGLVCAGFLGPLGLSLFRLSACQIPWRPATWLCFLLAPICFLLGRKCAPDFLNWADRRLHGKVLTARAERRPRLLFFFGLGVFAAALATMLIKWRAAGYLPLFADRPGAYFEFMAGEGHSAPAAISSMMYPLPQLYNLFVRRGWLSLFQIWLVPSIMMLYGLKANRPMKAVCGAVGLMGIFVTMMLLFREIYLLTMFSLMVTTYFSVSRKKLISVLIILALTYVGFGIMSKSRGFSNEQLRARFEMGEMATSRQGRAQYITKKPRPDYVKSLPSTLLWVYGYYALALDNFDYLVEKNDRFYYGLAQGRPLLVILRMAETRDISTATALNPDLMVAPGHDAHSFLREPYLDFGLPGVAFSLFFWGLVFGAVEAFHLRFRGALSLLGCALFGYQLIFLSFVNFMNRTLYMSSFGLLCILFFFIYDFRKSEKGD